MRRPASIDRRSVRGVLTSLADDPRRWIREWNWKSAITSSVARGALFFAVNLTVSWEAARAALITEVALRAVTSGFYGSLTARFRHVEPAWAASLTAAVLLPAVSHGVELLAHWLRGTDALGASVAASVAFTMLSTTFNLHLMRHGVLIVGRESGSLLSDIKAMPALARQFLVGGDGPPTVGRRTVTHVR